MQRPAWLPGPVVAAPMAGGPSTPDLVAAVTAAGGLGFLAAGNLTPDGLTAQLQRIRELEVSHFGVNLFLLDRDPADCADPAALAAYAERLAPVAGRFGAGLGAVDPADDDYRAAKIDVLVAARVPVVSFTFGLPSPEEVARLRAVGSVLLATVCSPDEALDAMSLGLDGLVVQGPEAGGHRGTHCAATIPDERPLDELLPAVIAAVGSEVPVIAAGGLMTAEDVTGVLNLGAAAAQCGTAFLRCPEAGTNPTHRAALTSDAFARTHATRAFTGRVARSLLNDFAREHDAAAPSGYPDVHNLTRPLRAAATQADDPQWTSLWAGTGWQLGHEASAAEVLAELTP